MSDQKKSNYSDYLKYSGIALEMFVTIFLGTYLGQLIDKKVGLEIPIFLLLFLFLALGISFYRVFKSLK